MHLYGLFRLTFTYLSKMAIFTQKYFTS